MVCRPPLPGVGIPTIGGGSGSRGVGFGGLTVPCLITRDNVTVQSLFSINSSK